MGWFGTARRARVGTAPRMALVAAVLLFAPARIRAQAAERYPGIVSWPLVDFVISGDSTYGVRVMLSPNLHSTQGRRGGHDIFITLDPVSARRWIQQTMPVVDSVAKMKRDDRNPFALGWLHAVGDRMAMSVGLLGFDPHKQPFRFVIADLSNPKHGLSVTASAEQLRELFTSIDAVAQTSALDKTDSTVRVAGEVDTPPRLVHRDVLGYPRAEMDSTHEGRVLAEFVVDTGGHAVPASFRVIFSDGAPFTDAARTEISTARFAPGRLHGSAVPVRVEMWVNFILDR